MDHLVILDLGKLKDLKGIKGIQVKQVRFETKDFNGCDQGGIKP